MPKAVFSACSDKTHRARLAGPKRGIFWLEHWDFIARICWNSMGFDGAYRTATVQTTTRQPFFAMPSKFQGSIPDESKQQKSWEIVIFVWFFYLQFLSIGKNPGINQLPRFFLEGAR